MFRPISSRLAQAFGLALCLACFAPDMAAAPAPASMVVSLVVEQSCLVTQAGDVGAPAVNCLHGEPWLVSQADAPPAPVGLSAHSVSAIRYGSRRAAGPLWTVTF